MNIDLLDRCKDWATTEGEEIDTRMALLMILVALAEIEDELSHIAYRIEMSG